MPGSFSDSSLLCTTENDIKNIINSYKFETSFGYDEMLKKLHKNYSYSYTMSAFSYINSATSH